MEIAPTLEVPFDSTEKPSDAMSYLFMLVFSYTVSGEGG